MDVKESIQEKFKLHNNRALEIVHGCKDVIRNQLQIKVPFILSIHIERYEYLYEKFRQIGQSDLMNLALQQKEELLNIKEALTERLQEDFGKEELENKFNYEKLTIDQRKRFQELVLKMQK